MRQPNNQSRFRACRAFTLVEILVAIGIVALVGAMVVTFLNTGLMLFAKTFSVTAVEAEGRGILSKMREQLNRSLEFPTLLDESGNAVASGQGGLGVRFRVNDYEAGGSQEVVPLSELGTPANFTQVAFLVENGRFLRFYPNYVSSTNRGPATLITNSLVAPTAVGGSLSDWEYPFNYATYGTDSPMLEVNMKILARRYGERLARQAGAPAGTTPEERMQNANTFFQLRSLIWLKNGDLL